MFSQQFIFAPLVHGFKGCKVLKYQHNLNKHKLVIIK